MKPFVVRLFFIIFCRTKNSIDETVFLMYNDRKDKTFVIL